MNVAIAFGAGLLSFLSPCVLPLVPAFLADLTGAAVRGEPVARSQALRHAAAFVLGFSAVFTGLWLAIAAFASAAGELRYWFERIGGLFLIVLGLHLTGVITIPLLATTRQFRVGGIPGTMWRSFAVGVTFGAGWTPCVGPYLGLIVGMLLVSSDLAAGGVLLFAYALGIGLPFLVAAFALDRLRGSLQLLRRRARAIEIAGGTLVVVMGVLLMSGRLNDIAQRFSFLIPDGG
jgi:cytochrome c-type biogenesis protein